MNVFGIGLPEMAVIAAIALLVFGPKRLPELGRSLGRTLKGFQSASREFEQEFRQAIDTETVRVTTAERENPVTNELPTPAAALDPATVAGGESLDAPGDAAVAGPASTPSS